MTLMLRRLASTAGLAAMLPLTAVCAHAQAQTGPAPHAQIVSGSPFGAIFKLFSGEYERRHLTSTSWGASGSLFDLNDAQYRNAQLFYRYYPQGSALNGFYIGARGGVHRVRSGDASATFFGAGFEVGYEWLLGQERNFAVSTGAGATRLFGGALSGAQLTIPTIRLLNIGWSF